MERHFDAARIDCRPVCGAAELHCTVAVPRGACAALPSHRNRPRSLLRNVLFFFYFQEFHDELSGISASTVAALRAGGAEAATRLDAWGAGEAASFARAIGATPTRRVVISGSVYGATYRRVVEVEPARESIYATTAADGDEAVDGDAPDSPRQAWMRFVA